VPQSLADLPYAPYLEPPEGDLTREGDYTEIHLADAEFEELEAGNARVSESAITGVTFTGGGFPRSRFHDVWVSQTRWLGTNLAEIEWRDVTVLDSVLAGVPAYEARLRRVTFARCKINTLNLRGATVQDVVFEGCELMEVDFGDAALTNVTFPGSTLRLARFTKAKLTEVDLRGARELDIADGYDSLGGAIVDRAQLVELAPALAQTLGIVVR
jgi:uncharacterized protein YjbI with pentapeptide repeats